MLYNYDAAIEVAETSTWAIASPNPEVKANLPYLQEAGCFYAKPGYYTQRVDLPSYLLLCTLRGKGILQFSETNAEKLELLPGTLCWIDCRQWHRYYCDDIEGWDFIWLHIYGGFLEQYYSEYLRINQSCLTQATTASVVPVMRTLVSMTVSSKGLLADDYLAAEQIHSLITKLLLGALGDILIHAIDSRILEAMAYINQNYAHPISLGALAGRVYLNKYYFHRLFTQSINCTPHSYINMVRLRHSKQLLRDSDLSVREIANQVGFEDDSNFIQTFKRIEKTTPLRYRKDWKGSRHPESESNP